MSLFNLPVVHRSKPVSVHPWSKTIKDEYPKLVKYAHNSVKNVVYPKPKEKIPYADRVQFTVIGNRCTKEFIYCVHLVQGMHKYRWRSFDAPIIRGVTGVEWPEVINDIKNKYGGLAYCISNQVVVLYNDKFLGGEIELKDLIETRYSYRLALNYEKESIVQFANFIKSSGRACAYLHISIDDKPIGTLVFMLFSDIVPITCNNFLRLCNAKKGGYSGTPVHRIVKDGWIQCGGYGLKNTPMECENFIVPHDRRGVLGMANAGRHLDCSTQFYVLLQPANWMKCRFVAFGQLIDGEKTLQELEKVSTFYESPISNVIIYKAGVLNLDCQDIMINKRANEYIDSHIEDLVAVGELFYQTVMEHVFLEIEFREISKLEQHGEGYAGAEGEEEEAKKDIRATQRFLRKKEEIINQLQKSRDRVQSITSKANSVTSKRSEKDNNDFDVEDYNYEPEEYSYTQATPSLVVKPTIPFYLPLTDRPYPEEVDSIFDLKRFLQGDYCLEADLNKKAIKISTGSKKFDGNKMAALSDVFNSYKQGSDSDVEEEEDIDNFDEADEREMVKYLMAHGEHVSFSGAAVRKIAKKFVTENPIVDKQPDEHFTDEEIRRMRLAYMDLKTREGKKISISAEPWEIHAQIKRRQTGFVRPKDLAKILMMQDDDNEEEKDANRSYGKRKVSLSIPEEEFPHEQIKRRQTGFDQYPGLPKRRTVKKSLSDDDGEKDDNPIDANDDGYDNDDDELGVSGAKVRIAPQQVSTAHDKHNKRRPTFNSDIPDDDDDEDEVEKTRPSVLMRLYDDFTLDENDPVPTLKDYKPLSELKFSKKNLNMLTINSGLKEQELLRRDTHFRPSLTGDDDSFEQLLAMQHGKKFTRKISSDYVKTIDHMERKPETSLRSVEFAKTRPSMTVSQYQLKNQLYAMEMKKKEGEELSQLKEEEKKVSKSPKGKLKGMSGLRLPGDTPLYGSPVRVIAGKAEHMTL